MPRVLVALSGGIDSGTSAKILIQKNFEVIGVTMKMCQYNDIAIKKADEICKKLNIQHQIIDVREEFKNKVINNFIDEYMNGHTPNPCIICNRYIKFKILFDKAIEYKCDNIATGHYADIGNDNGRFFIRKAEDKAKDQSYMLWGLPQEYLRKTIFPMAHIHKKDLNKPLDYKESNDICFIPDGDYRKFLQSNNHDQLKSLEGGNFIYNDHIVGHHRGYPYYTIGQRSGLGIALGHPVYVKEINNITNEVILGDEESLYSSIMKIHDINLMKYSTIKDGYECTVKVRYHDNGHRAKLYLSKDVVMFNEPVKSITSGQSAVFYEDDDVLGGAIIS